MAVVENTGQIQLSSTFGQWIASYARDPRFTRYLEVGTWNGRGSTCCIYEGFRNRTDSPHLLSYEIHRPRYEEAASAWAGVPSIEVVHARILEDSKCPTAEEVSAVHPSYTRAWHMDDIRWFWSCRYRDPGSPEVVLLDGGEYLTYFEYQTLKSLPSIRVFLLDDTAVAKCKAIHDELISDPAWVCTAGSSADRNGWAVFERR
jgi:hypothetical protein